MVSFHNNYNTKTDNVETRDAFGDIVAYLNEVDDPHSETNLTLPNVEKPVFSHNKAVANKNSFTGYTAGLQDNSSINMTALSDSAKRFGNNIDSTVRDLRVVRRSSEWK